MKYAPMEEKKIQVRLPESLRFSIEQAAKRNGRSMNAEIVHCLENGIPDVSKYLLQIESKAGYRYNGESPERAFVRLVARLHRSIASEILIYSNILNLLNSQNGNLAEMISQALEMGIVPEIPNGDNLRRVYVPKGFEQHQPSFKFFKAIKEISDLSSSIPINNLETKVNLDALTKLICEIKEYNSSEKEIISSENTKEEEFSNESKPFGEFPMKRPVEIFNKS